MLSTMAMEYTISSGESEKLILASINGKYNALQVVESVEHTSRDIHVRMQYAARYALSNQKNLTGCGAILVLCRYAPSSGCKRQADDDDLAIAFCLLNVPPEFQTPQSAN